MNSVESETANVVLQSLDNAEQRVLIPGGADARYVSTGHLVLHDDWHINGRALRRSIAAGNGRTSGLDRGRDARPERTQRGRRNRAGQFTVSASGTLLYATGGIGPIRESSMVWVDRTGVAQPLTAAPAGQYMSPRLSPDGKKVAMQVRRGRAEPPTCGCTTSFAVRPRG